MCVQSFPAWLKLTLLCLAGFLLILLMVNVLPPGIDWYETFRPAAREALLLRNPYQVEGFYYAIWALLPLMPLALLPEAWGRALYFLMSTIGFSYAAWRMGGKPLAVGAFLFSPPVMHCLLNANLDWMPLLGVVLPPQIGLFLLVIKPQMAFGVGIFWLVEAWRKGRAREVLRVFAPVTICLLISFALFGLWPLRFERTLNMWWNASLWPMSIPVGLALLVAGLHRRRVEYTLAASPCLSPYVLFHSWAGALMAVIASQAEFLAAVVGLWLLVIMRAVQGGF